MLDRFLQDPRLRRAYGPLLAAPAVRGGWRLVWREWSGERSVRQYRLRRSHLVAHLRHPYVDMWVLDEIFRRGIYAVPPEVERALRALPRPLRVVDLGACVGLAGLFFETVLGDVSVIAFEPDATNRGVLERTIAANHSQGRWTVVPACAGARDGTVPFISDHFLSRIDPDGASALAQPVPVVDVFPYLRDADLVKMDVQGAEWDLLADPRWLELTVPAIVLEYHPRLAPSPDAGARARARLTEAGYRTGPARDEHAGEGTIWAWRPG